MTADEVDCPTCDGAGELTECANDGPAGCSHVFDRTWQCADCDGTGSAQSPNRTRRSVRTPSA